MKQLSLAGLSLFPALALTASCQAAPGVDSASSSDTAFEVEQIATFDEPWAGTFVPGLNVVVVTEKAGKLVGRDMDNGRTIAFNGLPEVDYGGQGGLGDIAFLQSEAAMPLSGRTIFLSYAEAGQGDTRGAAVGKGTLSCRDRQTCEVRDWKVIWRQLPKVSGRGHYSHRLLFSPDEQYLYVASGERQKMQPAQDLGNNLGSIVRLTLDGAAATGNPFGWTDEPATPVEETRQVWSYGHRNILGLDWDAQGRLWDLEHGPRGGDELNLVLPGKNYGWPVVSNGVHYNGDAIPDHDTRPDLEAPKLSWTPVIAPGDMHFYRGDLFPEWKGDALIAGLATEALIRVEIDGDTATEAARYGFDNRLRSVFEGPDGAVYLLEDADKGRLLKLTPR